MANHERVTFGLVGVGGFAREVMPLVISQALTDPMLSGAEIVYVSVSQRDTDASGIPITSEQDFLSRKGRRLFNIAIGDPALRRSIARRYEELDCEPLSIRAPSVRQVGQRVSVGRGSIICDGAILTQDIVIGDYFHCNLNAYVAHDCEIGNFVTFAPGVQCNGHVAIGNDVYVGSGAILRNGLEGAPIRIEEGSTVGMGAVVTKSVVSQSTVVGVPAREVPDRR